MANDDTISEQFSGKIAKAIEEGASWMAYIEPLYPLELTNPVFFNNEDEAIQYQDNNFSDRDSIGLIHFVSASDLISKINTKLEPFHSYRQREQSDTDQNGLTAGYTDPGPFAEEMIAFIESQQLSNNKTSIMNEQ